MLKAMRVITVVCWVITALALAGVVIWFLTGTVFGFMSDRFNLDWSFGTNMERLEILTGPYQVAGTYDHTVTGIDSLNIDWVHGDVSVTPYNGADIRITEYAQRELRDEEKLRISAPDGTLTIKYRENSRPIRMPRKKLEVLIPVSLSGSFKSFTAGTVSGSITVDSISADRLKTNTISGAIQVAGASSPALSLESTSGALTAERVSAGNLNLNSISGSIWVADSSAENLDCDTTSGSVNVSGDFNSAKLNSISGRLTINNSAQGSVLNADSTSGSIDASGAFEKVGVNNISGSVTIRSAIVPSKLKAETTSGSITVSAPVDGTIPVNHSSLSGRFSSDIPVIMQSGGAQFELSSLSGSIKIHEFTS